MWTTDTFSQNLVQCLCLKWTKIPCNKLLCIYRDVHSTLTVNHCRFTLSISKFKDRQQEAQHGLKYHTLLSSYCMYSNTIYETKGNSFVHLIVFIKTMNILVS